MVVAAGATNRVLVVVVIILSELEDDTECGAAVTVELVSALTVDVDVDTSPLEVCVVFELVGSRVLVMIVVIREPDNVDVNVVRERLVSVDAGGLVSVSVIDKLVSELVEGIVLVPVTVVVSVLVGLVSVFVVVEGVSVLEAVVTVLRHAVNFICSSMK